MLIDAPTYHAPSASCRKSQELAGSIRIMGIRKRFEAAGVIRVGGVTTPEGYQVLHGALSGRFLDLGHPIRDLLVLGRVLGLYALYRLLLLGFPGAHAVQLLLQRVHLLLHLT